MQVNNTSQTSPSVKGLAEGERPTEKVEISGQATLDTGKTQAVPQHFAKLETALLQWFFQNCPELGDTMAQISVLQQQLSSDNLSAMAGDKLEKALALMNALLISPGGDTEHRNAPAGKTIQNFLALIEEFQQMIKEQSPGIRTQVDNIAVKLTDFIKQLKSASGEASVFSKNMGTTMFSGQASLANNPIVTDSHMGEAMTAPTQASGKNEKVISQGENSGANDTVTGDSLSKEVPAASVQRGGNPSDSSKSFMVEHNVLAEPDAGEPAPHINGTQGITTEPKMEKSGEKGPVSSTSGTPALPDDEGRTGLLNRNQDVAGKLPGQVVNNAASVQKKIGELLQSLTETLDQDLPNAKLRTLLQDMASCAKSLQVNPETEWESLLRYPVIYKQTLAKAINFLQELSDLKTNDNIHGKILDLMQEVTANIHVQNSVNQLRQENPAQQTMYFQIPLKVGDDIRNGEMLVVHQREKQGNKWDILDSWYKFYLETQVLGPVQITLHAAQKQLNIQFTVTDTQQSELFEQHKSQLSQILTHYGYEVSGITCGVGTITPLFLLDTDSANRQCIDITI